MYVVGKTWCHSMPHDATKKNEYENYEDAKLAYKRMVDNERMKTHLYGYKRCNIFTNSGSKNESTVFTDNNIHVDRNDYNFCEVFLYHKNEGGQK